MFDRGQNAVQVESGKGQEKHEDPSAKRGTQGLEPSEKTSKSPVLPRPGKETKQEDPSAKLPQRQPQGANGAQPSETTARQSKEKLPGLPPNTQAAVDRVRSIRGELKEMGVLTGPASVAKNPLMINGEPAVLLVVGDVHQEAYESLSCDLQQRLQEKFGLKGQFLEGRSIDPSSKKQLEKPSEERDRFILDNTLSVEEGKTLGLAEQDPKKDGYHRVDYSDCGFPQVFGIERADPEGQFIQDCIGTHRVGVMKIVDELEQLPEGEVFMVKAGGKYTSTWLAKLRHSDDVLRKAYGDEFPALPAFFNAGQKTFANGETKNIIYMGPQHQGPFIEYAKQHELFFRKTNFEERNPIIARNVAQTLGTKGEEIGSLNALTIGLGHVFSKEGVSPPSVPDYLAVHGISSVSVLAKPVNLGLSEAGLVVLLPDAETQKKP